jgi:hypothetical protein
MSISGATFAGADELPRITDDVVCQPDDESLGECMLEVTADDVYEYHETYGAREDLGYFNDPGQSAHTLSENSDVALMCTNPSGGPPSLALCFQI